MNKKFFLAGKKTFNNLKQTIPVLILVVLLISFAIALFPSEFFAGFFSGNILLDPFLGAVLGSIAAGSPSTSYVIGGELLSSGVSLIAITAFLLSWVLVGFIQFPAESLLLGKKFALARNIIAFASSILIAFLTVFSLNILGMVL
jgi:uncharacterized membrane protein YraQ (UPF0718 family)